MTKITSTMDSNRFEVKAFRADSGSSDYLSYNSPGFEIEIKFQNSDATEFKSAMEKVARIVEGLLDVKRVLDVVNVDESTLEEVEF